MYKVMFVHVAMAKDHLYLSSALEHTQNMQSVPPIPFTQIMVLVCPDFKFRIMELFLFYIVDNIWNIKKFFLPPGAANSPWGILDNFWIGEVTASHFANTTNIAKYLVTISIFSACLWIFVSDWLFVCVVLFEQQNTTF